MTHRIERIAEIRDWRTETALRKQSVGGRKLIGVSSAMEKTRDFIRQVGEVFSPVLLLGET